MSAIFSLEIALIPLATFTLLITFRRLVIWR